MTDQMLHLSQQDRQFIMQAARGGLAEIRLSELAVARVTQDELKQFGQQMIRDHTDATNELKELLVDKGENMADRLDPDHTELMNKLSSLTGMEFDHAYINAMVKDHTKIVSEFERETTSGHDSELKEWARKTLPKLQRYLRMAQDLCNRQCRTAASTGEAETRAVRSYPYD